uniref:Putative membrane protein n=1 Tax=Streptomyces sp. NRRL 11266 TaxID=299254 RepID=Q1MX60_9ACTN|nr:putative membrane protein [Streptomyces sp. NRRL 11266]
MTTPAAGSPHGAAPAPAPAPTGPPPEAGRSGTYGVLVVPAVLGLFLVLAFAGLMIPGLRSPAPTDMPLGLAGPGPTVQQVEAQLAAAAPDAFEVKRYADEAEARTALREQDVLGAIVIGPSPKQPPGLLIASAAGDAPTTAATTAYEQLTKQLGTPQQVDDVAPLPENDTRGVSAVLLCVALTIGALIFQLVLSLAAAHVGAAKRWLSCFCYAVVAGAAGALFAGPVTGTLDGHFLELLGIATLLSLTVVGIVAACQALLGALGIAVGALLVLPLGLASSGGVVDPHFQPAFYGAVSEYLPTGSAVSLLRRVLYFDGNAVGGPLLTLLLWAAGAWLVTLVSERIRPFQPLMVIVPASAVGPAAARTA